MQDKKLELMTLLAEIKSRAAQMEPENEDAGYIIRVLVEAAEKLALDLQEPEENNPLI